MSLALLTPQVLLFALLAVAIAAVLMLVLRPSLTRSREGKMFAFGSLFLLPVIAVLVGGAAQYQRSEQTNFCLSCHIMAPWGQSLHVDNQAFVAAAHFQNHRVPADAACYTCHTDYGQFGTLHAKLEGLHHVYVQYFGTPMNPIKLYEPYNNRECLHCHAGARSFEQSPTHDAMMSLLKNNQLSCVSSGCHDMVHQVQGLKNDKMWYPKP